MAALSAFAMGLQQAASPNDSAGLMQSMMSSAYQNFWQGAGQSFSSHAAGGAADARPALRLGRRDLLVAHQPPITWA